jgi:hypothetical protein
MFALYLYLYLYLYQRLGGAFLCLASTYIERCVAHFCVWPLPVLNTLSRIRDSIYSQFPFVLNGSLL